MSFNFRQVFFIRKAIRLFVELIEIVLENCLVSTAVQPELLCTKSILYFGCFSILCFNHATGKGAADFGPRLRLCGFLSYLRVLCEPLFYFKCVSHSLSID